MMGNDRLLITLFFCVETFSRGLLLAVVPLELLAYFGDTQRVTLFYAGVAIFGLGNSILVPWFLKNAGTRRVVASAGILTVFAAALLATENILAIAGGLAIRVLAGGCVEIPMTAYIMARIPRHRLSVFEPSRLFFQGACIAIAPWFGFYLQLHVSAETPFIVVGAGGIIMFCLASTALPAYQANSGDAVLQQPVRTVARFFQQPRLRLAWLLALIRSSFWAIFNIYAPIFSVTCGWKPSAAAAVLSVGTASLFLVGVWGRLSRNIGVRKLLMTGYFLCGVSLVLTAVAAVWMPEIAPLGLVAAAFSASILDGPGNVPFLRATRFHERPAMAGIYVTYRDVSQFAPIVVFSLILAVSQLGTAFGLYAVVLFGAARLSRLIHPRIR